MSHLRNITIKLTGLAGKDPHLEDLLPSELLEIVIDMEKALAAENPDLKTIKDKGRFISLFNLREGCIEVETRNHANTIATYNRISNSLRNSQGSTLKPDTINHLQGLKKNLKRYDLNLNLEYEQGIGLEPFSINGDTPISEPEEYLKSYTFVYGKVMSVILGDHITLATETGNIRLVEISDTLESYVMSQVAKNTLQKFKVEGIAWRATHDLKIRKMKPMKIEAMEKPTIHTLRLLGEIMGGAVNLETYKTDIILVTSEDEEEG